MHGEIDRLIDRVSERWGTRPIAISTASNSITVSNVLRTFPDYFPKTWNHIPLPDHRIVSFPTGVRSTHMDNLLAFATTKPTKEFNTHVKYLKPAHPNLMKPAIESTPPPK